jgi:hypothetical protein
MEAVIEQFALDPPTSSDSQERKKTTSKNQMQTAGQYDIEEESPFMTTMNRRHYDGKAEHDYLDDVADARIPKTINADMASFELDDRAKQVVSPDALSTLDGTSTIGSAASEPTTETGISNSRSTSMNNGGKVAGRSSSRGGSSRGGSRRNSPVSQNTPRRNYRNAYSGTTNRMNQSTVPRPFKRAGPLSYSKAVRLGTSGGTHHFGGREVDDKTRAVLADMNHFDSAQLETQ